MTDPKFNAKMQTSHRSHIIYLINGPNPASFCLFSFFSQDKYSTNLTVNDKNVDSVLETRTRGSKMELIDILALIFIIRQFINFVI